MKILVTGAAGYIGSVLCPVLLEAGHDVLGVDCFAYNNESAVAHMIGRPGFGFALADARDLDGLRPLVEGADAVIPLAAVVGAPACDAKPEYAARVNRDAVVGLVGMLSPNQRVIYPNTNSGYGQGRAGEFVTEDSPLEPISHYGRTKVDAERAVLDHPMGVSLRLATVFGVSPRMRFDLMVNDFARVLVTRRLLEIYQPQYRRNFVHVRDVAAGFLYFLGQAYDDVGAFNLGDPDGNLTKVELALAIAGVLGLPPESISAAEGEDPDRRDYFVSNDRIRGTGFSCVHSLEDGVRAVAGYAQLLTPPAMAKMRNA